MRSLLSLLAVALLTVGMLLAGCTSEATPSGGTQTPGAGETPTPTPTPSPTPTLTPSDMTPQEVLDEVNTAMNAIQSFHLTGEAIVQATENNSDPLMTMTLDGMGNVGGDWQMTIDMELSFGGVGANLISEARAIGDTVYIRNPATGVWETGDAELLFGTGDFFDDTSDELTLQDPQMEITTLDGTQVFKITGTNPQPTTGSTVSLGQQADPTVTPSGTGTPQEMPELAMTMWVETGTFRVIQMEMEQMLPAEDFEGVVPEGIDSVFMRMTINYSNYDEPVDVEVPEGVNATPSANQTPTDPTI